MNRAPGARWVDPGRSVAFTFEGRALAGMEGDTIASALLANGVRVVARSFKRHRPRGILAAGMEEPNAYVRVEDGHGGIEANALATRVRLTPGMRVSGLHAWPSVSFDVGAIADRFAALMPAGFYYKTFLWPSWKAFEPAVRAAAGLDRVPEAAPPSRVLNRHAHCDVLVVGAGPAGLAAARACAEAGSRVIVVEDRAHFGGGLAWGAARGEADAWIAEQVKALRACGGVTLLPRTMAVGYYEHNLVAAIERFDAPSRPEAQPDQRLWQIRARQVILATGSVERPLVFPGNDVPGVMLASAALEYLRGYGVAVARRAAVFTNNDSAYLAASALKHAGVEVAAIVDVRDAPGEQARDIASRDGLEVLAASHVARVHGRASVRAIDVAGHGASRCIDCDALIVSGGWNPQVQLFAHCGGKLRYDAPSASFVPGEHALGCLAAGGINARSLADEIAADAHRAASTALAGLGKGAPRSVAAAPGLALPATVAPWWCVPGTTDRNDAWVDLHNDVTQADIALAVRENYASVEHLKRYTTLGMGPDQGRTGNVNGLAILAQALGKDIAESGTTRFRPPVVGASLATLAASMQGDLYVPRRELPARERHVELGARFQDYSGWQRPAWYAREGLDREECVQAECRAVRERAGLFDSSPLGKLEVRGPDAEEFLSRIYANGIRSLKPGGVRYGVMLLESGYLLDDGVAARLAADHFLVGPSSGAAQRVLGWMEEWLQTEWPGLRVAIVDVTSTWASFSVAGPAARDILARAGTGIDLSPAAFPHMGFRAGTVMGVRARVQRVSFSGELQYEVSVPAGEAARVMDGLLAAGQAARMEPVGLDAWLRLRIDKGYLHLGTDTDGTTTPDDVGLAGLYAKKAEDFIGRRSLSRPAVTAPDREQLVGLRVTDGNVPLAVGACILKRAADRFPCDIAGHVTSSAFSVALGRPVALARLRNGRARTGERVVLRDARGVREAEVCGTVAYDPEGARLRG